MFCVKMINIIYVLYEFIYMYIYMKKVYIYKFIAKLHVKSAELVNRINLSC